MQTCSGQAVRKEKREDCENRERSRGCLSFVFHERRQPTVKIKDSPPPPPQRPLLSSTSAMAGANKERATMAEEAKVNVFIVACLLLIFFSLSSILFSLSRVHKLQDHAQRKCGHFLVVFGLLV